LETHKLLPTIEVLSKLVPVIVRVEPPAQAHPVRELEEEAAEEHCGPATAILVTVGADANERMAGEVVAIELPPLVVVITRRTGLTPIAVMEEASVGNVNTQVNWVELTNVTLGAVAVAAAQSENELEVLCVESVKVVT